MAVEHLELRQRHQRFLRVAGGVRARSEPGPGAAGHRLYEPMDNGSRPHAHGRHARAPALAHFGPRRQPADQRGRSGSSSSSTNWAISSAPRTARSARASCGPCSATNRPGERDFRIQFDPVNTLAIAMISEEMRRRNLTKLGELSPDTRKRLSQIYTELARSLPDDPAAYGLRANGAVGGRHADRRWPRGRCCSRSCGRRSITARCRRPAGNDCQGPATRRQGDELTDLLGARSGPRGPGACPMT